MFALNLVAKLVDDPEVQAEAKDLLLQVGRHFVLGDYLLQVTAVGRPEDLGDDVLPFFLDSFRAD